MNGRYRDWIDQALADLALARTASDAESHEGACFASQQAAEKAIKGHFGFLGGECWGHSLTKLLQDLPERVRFGDEIAAAARRLDRLYIPTRDPNGFDAGKPADYFTREDSDAAIADAKRIIGWVAEQGLGPPADDLQTASHVPPGPDPPERHRESRALWIPGKG